MVKSKKNVSSEGRRTSQRLANKPKTVTVEKKRPAPKKALKAKKAKPENGNTKAEEPKAEATDAK